MKRKKLIKRVTVVITLCSLIGLTMSTYHIKKLTKGIEVDIATSREVLEKNKLGLQELHKEMEEMESLEYIEKVAREQLGMVDSDTIIIKEKQ